MSVATGASETAAAGGGGGNRVFFQSPRGGGGSGGSNGGASREDSVSAPAAVVQVQQRRHQQGKVTVKYDRKELRKRLVLEEWIVEQLGQLYGCEVRGRGGGHAGTPAVPPPAAASLALGILLPPRVVFWLRAGWSCHRHLQMTFPAPRPPSSPPPRASAVPAAGKGCSSPRGERQGTARGTPPAAPTQPPTERPLRTRGVPAFVPGPGVPGGPGLPGGVWPGAAVPACPRGGAWRVLPWPGGCRLPLDASSPWQPEGRALCWGGVGGGGVSCAAPGRRRLKNSAPR